MPIIASDIKFYLSGGGANSDADASIGGAISTTEVVSTLNGLFDQVSSAETSAGHEDYRCIYVKNTHGSLGLEAAVAWISANVSADVTFTIGLGASAVNVQEQGPLGDENTAPTGPTFSNPTTQGGGLSIGTIPFGEFKAIWLKRVVAPGASAVNETVTIDVGGDTAA